MQPALIQGVGELAGKGAEGLAAAAAERVEGEIVRLDKANRQITLQRSAPEGTADSAVAPTEQYLLDHDPSFDTLKVGDQVTLKIDQLNGVPTVIFVLSK